MSRWKPDPNADVGASELLGRRLFDQPQLIGAADQKIVPSLDYRNFEDTRDGQVSLDRLGRANAEAQVIRYLTPRAIAGGEKQNPPAKEFTGWASIQKQRLVAPQKVRIDVRASPDPGTGGHELSDDDLTENIYHAHVEALDDKTSPYFLALHLKMLFEKYWNIVPGVRHSPGELGK